MPKKGKIKDTEILNRKEFLLSCGNPLMMVSLNAISNKQSEFSQKGENHCSAFPPHFFTKNFFLMKLRSKCTQEYTIQSMMIQQVYLPRDEKVTKYCFAAYALLLL